jgi:O-antigen ligase
VITRAEAIRAYNNDPSVQFRLIEDRVVTRQIVAHPVFGNGLGKSFIFEAPRYGVAPQTQLFIHNNYLWYAQRLGLVGLGLFMWVICVFLFRWIHLLPLMPRGDPWLGGLVVGSRVMLVTVLVVSIAAPYFNEKGNVTVIAVVMALAEVAGKLVDEDAGGAELSEAAASRAHEPDVPTARSSV